METTPAVSENSTDPTISTSEDVSDVSENSQLPITSDTNVPQDLNSAPTETITIVPIESAETHHASDTQEPPDTSDILQTTEPTASNFGIEILPASADKPSETSNQDSVVIISVDGQDSTIIQTIVNVSQAAIDQDVDRPLMDSSSASQEIISEEKSTLETSDGADVCQNDNLNTVELTDAEESLAETGFLIFKPKNIPIDENQTENEETVAKLDPVPMDTDCYDPDDSNNILQEPGTNDDPIEPTIQELQSQLTIVKSELEKAQQSLVKQEYNAECFREQRDSAVTERNSLMDMITRLNSEIIYLKDIHEKNSVKLKNAMNFNCEIISKNDELKTKELSLKYREELMEQEKKIINDRIQNLSIELNRVNLELETTQMNQSSKISSLEIQLTGKVEELAIADSDVAYLRSERIKLVQEVENLTQKLLDQHENENKICDDLRKKLNAKSKLADLYKSMLGDSNAKSEELMNGVSELQKLLNEAVEKYGELETKNIEMELNNETSIKQKDDTIKQLQEELQKLKDDSKRGKIESLNVRLNHISPTAAVTREFLKSGMSLAQIYNQLVQVSDELNKKTEENDNLKEAFATVIHELEENAPRFKRQNSQYENVMDNNSIITQQLESIELEYSQLKDDYSESVKVCNHFERENNRLKVELTDLGRQVCFLLKEIEISRGGNYYAEKENSNNTSSSELNSSNIISNNLVTFNDIKEIQSNNQKLLKLVRELTQKQEENDALKEQIETGEIQSKLDTLSTKISDLSASKERHTKMINRLIKQRDMYKKLYNDKMNTNMQTDAMEEDEMNNTNMNTTDNSNFKMEKSVNKIDEVKILELQLEDAKKQIQQHKEDYKKFEDLSDSKEKVLLGQIDKLRKELYDLNETYRKCYCSLETNNEKNKIFQNELNSQKRKVSLLEERNEKLNSKIAECEMSMKFSNDKASISENKLSQMEILVKNLQEECQFLRNSNSSLLKEKDCLNEEIQGQSSLFNNLQFIKDIIENKKNDDKIKLATKLDEFSRECSLLHLKLQEKQDKLSELFSIQTQQSKMEQEKTMFAQLKSDLLSVQNELEAKCTYIDELKQKLSNNEHGKLEECIKDLKNQINDYQLEINALKQQLLDSKNHMKQFCDLSEGAESELKIINDKFVQYQQTKEKELSDYIKTTEDLKEKCDELKAELSLQNNNHDELTKSQETIKALSIELADKKNSLDTANLKIAECTEMNQFLESKCAEKEVLCSEYIKNLSQFKDQIVELYKEVDDARTIKAQSEETLNQHKMAWDNVKKDILKEKESIEMQLADLKQQNCLLLDQVEALNAQITLSQSSRNLDSLNESMQGENSAINTSIEDEGKSVSQLMQILKYLRKERDLHCSKFSFMREENLKIKSQVEVLENKLKEAANSSVAGSIGENSSLTKHSDMVQKVQSFNAIAHNNNLLREERDSLLARVKELTETSKRLEESLSQLQIINDDLSKENNAVASRNACIQAECNRWKTRFNSLTEKANKTEDWKRLQNERETLAKMLSIEKDNIKKLRDESVHSKLEKSKLEEQCNLLNKQLATLNDDLKKQINETNQMSLEFTEAKASLLKKVEENKKLADDFLESRTKEIQIRKIAKQYKSQYEELCKNSEEDKKKLEALSLDTSNSESHVNIKKEYEQKILQIEKSNTEQNAELKSQISSSVVENNSLQREIELLKNQNKEIEEKAKLGLKTAKTKIFHMTESRDNLLRELKEANDKLEQFKQNNDENDDRLTALKSQFEGRIAKAEKEKIQLQKVQQNEAIQLNKQIETLTQKLNQMQKQLDTQQVSKPSTSTNQGEKTGNEPPTANIKPMAGSQQSIGGRRPVGDTPLASIRPMTSVSGVRTAAVLPNAQYSTTAAPIHHHPSTTGLFGETSTPPTASTNETEYIQISFTAIPQQSVCPNVTPPESTQDMDSEITGRDDVVIISPGVEQTVAHVTPRIETPTLDTPASNLHSQVPVSVSSGSSSVVTTSHSSTTEIIDDVIPVEPSSQKRVRFEQSQDKPNPKRQKIQKPAEPEAEFEVPTSSQKDESVIVVDSDEEDNQSEEDPSLYVYNMEEEEEDDDVEEEEDEDVEDGDGDEDDDNDRDPENLDEERSIDEERDDGNEESMDEEDEEVSDEEEAGTSDDEGIQRVEDGEEIEVEDDANEYAAASNNEDPEQDLVAGDSNNSYERRLKMNSENSKTDVIQGQSSGRPSDPSEDGDDVTIKTESSGGGEDVIEKTCANPSDKLESVEPSDSVPEIKSAPKTPENNTKKEIDNTAIPQENVQIEEEKSSNSEPKN